MPASLPPDGSTAAAGGLAGRPVALGARHARTPAEVRRPARIRQSSHWLGWLAISGAAVSITLITVVGQFGPSIAVPQNAPLWPPFFAKTNPGTHFIALSLWIAVLAGGAGVACGLAAVRRGWRPQPGRLIAGSLIGVLMLMLVPFMGSSDMLDYAVYGRITALGHNPYTMTPAQLQRTGDPIAKVAPRSWRHNPSPYGPLATASQAAASLLSGDSLTRAVFWLKAWDALAFLAVALALDRLFRREPARRARAHLLWTVNPLMLLAVMAGGHNDIIGVTFGLLAVLALRRLDLRSGLLAGLLVGLAIAVKAPFALFGLGLGLAAFRAPRALAGLGVGAGVILLPSYGLAGMHAVTSVLGESDRVVSTYQPWRLLADVVPSFRTGHAVDVLALVATVLLAAILLWRLPAGPPGLPAVRPVLALTLAWLICSPQQRAWYDVIIFPLLAVMPATRLDWIALARAAAGAAGQLPGNTIGRRIPPHWLLRVEHVLVGELVPFALVGLAAALVWLCLTGRIAAGRSDPLIPPDVMTPPGLMTPAEPATSG